LSSGPWRSSRASTKPSGKKGVIVTLWTDEQSVSTFKPAGVSRKSSLSSGAFDETVTWAGDLRREVVVRAAGSPALMRLRQLTLKELRE
jgi:hypothetical protein